LNRSVNVRQHPWASRVRLGIMGRRIIYGGNSLDKIDGEKRAIRG
jgi:hypothetical protein